MCSFKAWWRGTSCVCMRVRRVTTLRWETFTSTRFISNWAFQCLCSSHSKKTLFQLEFTPEMCFFFVSWQRCFTKTHVGPFRWLMCCAKAAAVMWSIYTPGPLLPEACWERAETLETKNKEQPRVKIIIRLLLIREKTHQMLIAFKLNLRPDWLSCV